MVLNIIFSLFTLIPLLAIVNAITEGMISDAQKLPYLRQFAMLDSDVVLSSAITRARMSSQNEDAGRMVRVRRSAQSNPGGEGMSEGFDLHDLGHDAQIEIEVPLFGQKYKLHLHPVRSDFFAPGFEAFSTDARGNRKSLKFDPSNTFYEGHIAQYPGSRVSAYFEDGLKLFARIELYGPGANDHQVIYVEPAWRYLNKPSSDHELIAYRASDVINDPENPVGYIGGAQAPPPSKSPSDASSDSSNVNGQEDGTEKLVRQKRQAQSSDKNTCRIWLVADYTFCQKLNAGSDVASAIYMIGVMQRIDERFRKYNFEDGLVNIGFSIAGIDVFCNATPPSNTSKDVIPSPKCRYPSGGCGDYFNKEKADNSWDITDFLDSFGASAYKNKWAVDTCVAHLFTYRSWKVGTLGLSYIGSPDLYSAGGICSQTYNMDNDPPGVTRSGNIAWSSYVNLYGTRIVGLQQDVVTTHELGHSFGTNHDTTSDCSNIPSSKGGNYLMYPQSNTGTEPNNLQFSQCSILAIKANLKARIGVCFVSKPAAVCGNRIVETNEDCDVGFSHQGFDDPCCDPQTCKFKGMAKCSPLNDDCCTADCRIASTTQACRQADLLNCRDITYCNGAKSCPSLGPPVSDNIACAHGGRCQKGKCQSFCESMKTTSCFCIDNPSNFCRMCCTNTKTNSCMPSTDIWPTLLNLTENIYLEAGMPCPSGFCNATHQCQVVIGSLTKRLFNFLGSMDASKFWAFVKNNIVGLTVIFTLMIWLPIALILRFCVDLPRQREMQRKIEEYESRQREIAAAGEGDEGDLEEEGKGADS